MTEIVSQNPDRHGYDFIPPAYLPPGKDEYWLRDRQNGAGKKAWRKLKVREIELLEKNGNFCSVWDNFLVTDPFDPALIRNSNFYGLIRLGAMQNLLLRHHDFSVPAGIRNSIIISCDIGDNAAIQDCSYISHYIIGDRVILSRIDEMQATNHAKFGNGVIKDGEGEDLRVWIDVMNEAGGRSILPFAEMICADAFLWACYRDDTVLTEKLRDITQKQYDSKRGQYGTVGSGSVIKSCAVIKDVAVGEAAYIKGANKLKNLTILSSRDEPSQIGEGVEMVNGIVGYGCHAFYGAKAVRFVMGRRSNLKYGARLIHSVLGDNSTVSCCEILNNLIFPVHEQHHNNSFLIASMVQGLSNMAAGATIGSNHNSRANDGEIRAGRGFWPGLSVTLKHSSRFASFVIIAKGNYPYELNITLPFSLVGNNARKDRLEVMPAYFWMHNLYALERNSWKAADRDKRLVKVQRIETDYLAPDTAEEIIAALVQMEGWFASAGIPAAALAPAALPPAGPLQSVEGPEDGGYRDPDYASVDESGEELPAPGLERHKRETVLLKPRKAWAAYREMLRFYAAKTLIAYLEERPELDFPALVETLEGRGGDASSGGANRVTDWVNLGGQIAPAFRVDALRGAVRDGRIQTWEAIHRAYDEFDAAYPLDRARHAWGVLEYLSIKPENAAAFIGELDYALETRRRIVDQVYRSRAKDFHDPFRSITYRNKEEMDQVVGKAGENFFVTLTRKNLAQFEETARALQERLRRT
jgi:NDP-sugar pyrophosphorylase family protein